MPLGVVRAMPLSWRCVGVEFAIGTTVIQRRPSSSSCVPCICNATPSVLPLSSNKLDVFPSFLSCGPSFDWQGFKFFSPEAARSKLGEVLRCDARSRPGLPVPGDRADQDLPTLFCRLGPKLSPRCQVVEVSQIACFYLSLYDVCLDRCVYPCSMLSDG